MLTRLFRHHCLSASVFFVSIVVVAGGCSTLSTTTNPQPAAASMTDRVGWDAFRPQVHPAPAVDILALNTEMRLFLQNVKKLPNEGSRLRLLLQQMTDVGLAELEYHPLRTLTAQETFVARSGNCLSYTSLFLALAREVGLDAHYQLVDVPPNWVASGDTVVSNKHINVLVKNVRVSTAGHRDYVVDFNLLRMGLKHPAKVVTDEYVAGLYFSNRAVEAMSNGELETAGALHARALLQQPDIAQLWVNTGVWHSRRGGLPAAEAAYKEALRLERGNLSAMSNLAKLYTSAGEMKNAQRYMRRVARYQARNPYYHLHKADQYYTNAEYPLARKAVRKAHRLGGESSQSNGLLAIIALKQGDDALAHRALVRAEALAGEDVKSVYRKKLAILSRS